MQAGSYYRNGYNCAKSVYLGVNDAISKKPNGKILKACTGFGGGIGKCGSICGALVGAELAIGENVGTTKPDHGTSKSTPAYESSAEMFNKFKKEFGAVDCTKLNHGDFSSPEHAIRCGKIVSKAAGMAVRIIKKNKKKKGKSKKKRIRIMKKSRKAPKK